LSLSLCGNGVARRDTKIGVTLSDDAGGRAVIDAIPPVLATDAMPPLLVTDAFPPLMTALGKTAREVASALRADMIIARRGATTFRNPIVRYINRHLDIGGHMIIPIEGGVLTVVREGPRQTIQIPDAVNTFLNRFDSGEFPQLEQR
jgi:hypothetical protein